MLKVSKPIISIIEKGVGSVNKHTAQNQYINQDCSEKPLHNLTPKINLLVLIANVKLQK